LTRLALLHFGLSNFISRPANCATTTAQNISHHITGQISCGATSHPKKTECSPSFSTSSQILEGGHSQTRTDDSPGNIFMRKLTLQLPGVGEFGVPSSESTPWIWGGCLGALGAVSLPLHYIKFIPNLRAAGKHFI